MHWTALPLVFPTSPITRRGGGAAERRLQTHGTISTGCASPTTCAIAGALPMSIADGTIRINATRQTAQPMTDRADAPHQGGAWGKRARLFSDRGCGAQARGFRAHIAAARATGLPLVIHTREADDDCRRILEDEMGKGAFRAVLHCYTGGRDLALAAIDLGLSISFTGIITFKKSQTLRDLATELPADRIMVETDSPYLAPGKYRGKRNEPSYVGGSQSFWGSAPAA